ncbi:alanine racemase [Cnuibacter physcomitrellae]|uniref:amino acid deaminase/aldolase n=1 Tax=Cnuibacter physcomitrellae TaxID=1619308 RepID=UPI0019BBCDE4|nr:amino acid deaminase/aldolase [Cnuibacter physcomitrellae]GGI36422.1 alanine racemase [Cnuibacter physcomitrellae]
MSPRRTAASRASGAPGTSALLDLTRPPAVPGVWRDELRYWPALAEATRSLETPYAVLGFEALAHNAHDMLRRAAGTPIRVASKSIRIRAVIDAVLALPGFHGILAYTLPEALWLAETCDDVVVGYPSVDRTALAALAADERAASRVTVMIDSAAHLDLIDSVVPASRRAAPLRVALELDAAFVAPGLGHLGAFRSPVFDAADATALAREVLGRPGYVLVGMMAYESQIAGVGNRPRGNPIRGRILDVIQRRSVAELRERRGAVVDAVRRLAPLEFVNGGGTGSLETTGADPSVTEIGAGSGLLGGHLFDTYSRFRPAPAAAFAMSVVRKPTPEMATVLGGGWIASGPPALDRLPEVVWPRPTRMVPREMAGEVQTPLTGRGAERLRIGDRVWFRHTKSGELSEHVDRFAVVEDGRLVGEVPSYRGEGKAFL